MSKNPADQKPTMTFAEAVATAPARATTAEPTAAATPGKFRISLRSNGVQLGWLGKNGSGWAALVDKIEDALTLELYPYDNVTYYRIVDTKTYMSVSDRDYIGFYGWTGARGFTLKDGHLISDYNGQALSLYSKDNGYLYAWDKYTVLDVHFDAL